VALQSRCGDVGMSACTAEEQNPSQTHARWDSFVNAVE
jgi:hypothetical protein